MPRSLKDILDHADELAERFERHVPEIGGVRGAAALRVLRHAALDHACAEAELADAVSLARAGGRSWASIGVMLGASGEAARQRYGQSARTR
ncbi:MAG: hypothetical protein ACYCXW_19425 [Solirubrobacteraceae bacterium]